MSTAAHAEGEFGNPELLAKLTAMKSLVLSIIGITAVLSFGLVVCPTAGAQSESRAAVGAVATPGAAKSKWTNWRGPLQTGEAPDARPPVVLSEQENLKWKTALPGSGSSTPIILGDRVFILAAIPVGGASAAPAGRETSGEIRQFVVLCFDRPTGQERWRRVVREQRPIAGHHKDHGYASASPVTDGEVLIAHFNSYGTYGLDLEGKVLWETDLGDMRTRNDFGEGSSPALDGDLVVVLWDHEGDDFIVALDKRTGKERWRQPRDEPTGWSTPLIVEHEGRKQVIANGTNRVRAYDLLTGEPLWDCAGQTANAIPTPVAAKGVVYATSGFRGSALQAIQLGRSGQITDANGLLWARNKGTPYVPSPLLYQGLLYYFAGNNAALSITSASDGEVHVDGERLEGIFGVYASPAAADGRVYVAGRDGSVWVLKAGPRVEVLSRAKFADGFDASPAPVGSELFLRGRGHLYCFAAAE
jgi:outer membrane protein assembly factor BamB